MLVSALQKEITPGGRLVIQPLPGIGDMVWHLRALRALSSHGVYTPITLLTRSKSQAEKIIGHEPWIHDVLFLDEKRHFGSISGITLGQDLKPYQFESAWILHHSPRYYMATSFAGIRKRFGYGFGWLKDFLTSPALTLDKGCRAYHPIKKMELFFKKHAIPLIPDQGHLNPNPLAINTIMARFKGCPQPWITMGFGATNSSRRWSSEKFAETIHELMQQGEKAVFLCGTLDEASIAHEIRSKIPKNAENVICACDQSLEETVALIARSKLFIGNDSGLLNIASSLQIPALGIFAGIGPCFYDTFPYDMVLSNERSDCPLTLETITSAQVLQAIQEKQLSF